MDPLRKLKCLWARFKISKLNKTKKPLIVSFFSIEMLSHNLVQKEEGWVGGESWSHKMTCVISKDGTYDALPQSWPIRLE